MKKKIILCFLFFYFEVFPNELISTDIEISEKLINAIEFATNPEKKDNSNELFLKSFFEYTLIKNYEHLIFFAFIESIILNKNEKLNSLENLRIIFSENKIKKSGDNFLINKKIVSKENLILLYLYSTLVFKNFFEDFNEKFNQKEKFNEVEFKMDEILNFNKENFQKFFLNFIENNGNRFMKNFIQIDVDSTIIKISRNIDLYFNSFKVFLEKSKFKFIAKYLFNLYIGTFFNKNFSIPTVDLDLKDKIMFSIPEESLEISSNIDFITNDNFEDAIKNFIMSNTMLTTKKYYLNKLNFESIWNFIVLKNYSGVFKDIIEKYNNKK